MIEDIATWTWGICIVINLIILGYAMAADQVKGDLIIILIFLIVLAPIMTCLFLGSGIHDLLKGKKKNDKIIP